MSIEKQTYRVVRGTILKILVKEFPRPVDSKALLFTLRDLGTELSAKELSGHTEYLSAKDYIAASKRSISGINIEMLTATPAGLDVVDEFDKDIGISTEGF